MNDRAISRHRSYQKVKLVLDRFHIGENICVVVLEIIDHECAGLVVKKFGSTIKIRRIVFICFYDKKWCLAQPGRL